ncbi:glycosyltransferase family 4 protein [Paenibacillus solisilvae]|uniref:Glycosyltransferase family 4 protein n=1 Tax=Paenibacillus solisilvae TaxID=2486751 RepID=A0ABW0VXY0_9BACL
MNVLLVNKFYYIKGGSETYLFALKEQLEAEGHHVVPFSMDDSKNEKTKYSEYFVENVDYNNMSFFKKIKSASNIIYSFESKRNIKRLLDDENIDISHLHLFQHQISPSILFPLKQKRIPVVYTVHDLKVMCPNYKMMTNNTVCEQCKDGKFYNAMKNKCVKNSLSASSISMLEAYFHKFMKIYDSYIDYFITPSEYYKQKMIEWGYPPGKITHIPNFVHIDKYQPYYGNDGYFLYLGRLSEEKGIMTLLKSLAYTKTQVKLVIAGTGPLSESIKEYISDHDLEDRVKLLGFVSGTQLQTTIQRSKCVVMPSEWYENGPLSLIESFAYGKPVIGSNIGGIPEHIDPNVNGLVFESKNAQELADKIDYMNSLSDAEINRFGTHARKKAETEYSHEVHFKQLKKIYDYLLAKKYNSTTETIK